jgi:hypothetical protein
MYLENKKTVPIHPNTHPEERLNQSSPLERYFLRPEGAKYDDLREANIFHFFRPRSPVRVFKTSVPSLVILFRG